MVQYFNSYSAEGLTYSLDMVRLNFDIGVKNGADFSKWMNEIQFDDRYDIKYTYIPKPYSYKHMWSISCPYHEVSFAMGMDLGRDRDDATKGYIEFNPNKCMNSEHFVSFFNHFTMNFILYMSLVRYDLAIDIPNERGECYLVSDNLTDYHKIVGKFGGITEYLGQRSHNGFVKLYDKTKESNLDYPLTRLELTINRSVSAMDLFDKFPTVYITDNQITMLESAELSANDRVIIELIRASGDIGYWSNRFTYRMRKKIEPYLANKVLCPDIKALNTIRNNALSYEK